MKWMFNTGIRTTGFANWFWRQRSSAAVFAVLLAVVSIPCTAGMALHSSHRYYQDSLGKPVFLVGYYGWSAVPDGYFIDQPSRYADLLSQYAPYGLNYIRISLGINRFSDSTNPKSWDGRPTPVPFAYTNGKADLDRWDSVFWSGLRSQCALAQRKGVSVHISIFDGVDIRGGGEAYRYANSFWNPLNQCKAFYSDPDRNRDGNTDANGEFYDLGAFETNTGIGRYQRRLIDKVVSETTSYGNVFYEVGNELLGSPSDWATAVMRYARSKTPRPITQCGGVKASNLQGWAQHGAGTPAEVKKNVALIVGRGHPAWEDPDGPALGSATVSPDDLRRAAWYSFVGGAAGWGGFTVDCWDGGSGFNKTKAEYYQYLLRFIRDSGAEFWTMVPNHDLMGHGEINSCLAKPGSRYVAYVLKDSPASLDLTAVSGSIAYRLYDPRTGKWTPVRSVSGGGIRLFEKPQGADDWVIYADVSLLER